MLTDTAIGMVRMIVIVLVYGQRRGSPRSKQFPVRRALHHADRRTLAANMPVQAQHPVGGRHDHMQIVGDQ